MPAFIRRGGGSFKKRNFMIKDGHRHAVYSPRMSGHTTFRVFPEPKGNGTADFYPQITPVAGDPMEGLCGSFAEVELIEWLGKDKIAFVTTTSDVDHTEHQTPARLFYNKINDFVKEESRKAVKGEPFSKALPVWAPWTEGKGILSLPQTKMLLQGVLIEHAGEPCKDKNGKVIPRVPVTLVLPRSATTDLEEKLVTKVNEGEDISAENSKIGDITSVQQGKAVRIYAYRNAENKTRYSVEPDFEATPQGNVVKPALPLDPNMVLSHFVPWEDLLNIQTAEWQIIKLLEAFGPEAVDFAFSDDSFYADKIPTGIVGAFDKTFGESAAPSQAAAPSPAATPAPAPQPVLTPEVTPPQSGVLQAAVVDPVEEDDIPYDATPEPAALAAAGATDAVAAALAAAKLGQGIK